MCFLRQFILMAIIVFIVSEVECDKIACSDDLTGKGFKGNFNEDYQKYPDENDYKGFYVAEYLLHIQNYVGSSNIPSNTIDEFCDSVQFLNATECEDTVRRKGYKGDFEKSFRYLRGYYSTMENLIRLRNLGSLNIISYFCKSKVEYVPITVASFPGTEDLYLAKHVPYDSRETTTSDSAEASSNAADSTRRRGFFDRFGCGSRPPTYD